MIRSEQIANKSDNLSNYKSFISIFWKVLILAILLGCLNSPLVLGQNRILVVSGGGARGAWGGGVIQNLVEKQHNQYQVIIGTSTGSLMAPLIVANDFDTLRTMYTSVTNKRIFNIDPFRVSKDGKEANIRGLRAVKRLILGKRTIGETKRLRKLINNTYNKGKYTEIQGADGHFIISVANFTNSHTYYFDSRDFYNSNDDRYRRMMVDHIWRSSNQPLFMTLDCTCDEEYRLVQKDMDNRPFSNGDCWVDTGIRDNVPLLRGIEYSLDNSNLTATDTIDVIINNIDSIDIDDFPRKKILASVIRSIDILSYDVRFNDVNIPGELVSESMKAILPGSMVDENVDFEKLMHENGEETIGDIVINYYFMPKEVYNIHPLDLYFNKNSMNEIWDLGLSLYQLDNSNIKTEVLSKKIAKLLIKKAHEQDEIYKPVLSVSSVYK